MSTQSPSCGAWTGSANIRVSKSPGSSPTNVFDRSVRSATTSVPGARFGRSSSRSAAFRGLTRSTTGASCDVNGPSHSAVGSSAARAGRPDPAPSKTTDTSPATNPRTPIPTTS